MSDDDMNHIDVVEETQKILESNPNDVGALFRQGCAYFKLDEYETAVVVLADCHQKAQKSKTDEEKTLVPKIEMWIRKCNVNLPESKQYHPPTPTQESTPAPVITTPEPSKEKIRFEHYQSGGFVYVTFFVKGRQNSDVEVSFKPRTLEVIIKLGDGKEYQHTFNPLYGPVEVSQCSYSVGPNKIEIKLKKVQDFQWRALEGNDQQSAPLAAPAPTPVAVTKPTGPAPRPNKDWEQLAQEISKEEEEEKPEGDAALNKLFRDIYARGDENTRRAMVKSFVESGGTVLSTNWSEVGSKQVDATPPSGMEFKKWGE